MPTFEYTATDAEGRPVRGTILGNSMDQAVGSLSNRGLQIQNIAIAVNAGDPLSSETPAGLGITSQRTYFETSVAGAMVDRVPLKNLMFFFRQFATMQRAGVPVVQSLDTLSKQAGDSKLSNVLREMGTHVKEGRPLSFGMQRYPEVFTPLMLAMVRAGEEGGFVDKSCEYVSDYLKQEIELRNLYRRVTFMPKVTIFSSIGIILAANAFIDSQAKGGMHIWSPLTQPITWLYLGPLIVAIWLFFKVGLANPKIKFGWDRFVLRIPYVGHTLEQLAMAKFGRAFGALYSGGVPIPRAMLLSADACGNEYVRALLYPAAGRMEEGAAISETLAATGALSPLVLDMLHTGETTGNLDQMLTKMSEFYEEETQVRSTQTGHILGVAAIIIVAIYVLIVLIKFYGSYAAAATGGTGGGEDWIMPLR